MKFFLAGGIVCSRRWRHGVKLRGRLVRLFAQNLMHEIGGVPGAELFQKIVAMEIDGARADAEGPCGLPLGVKFSLPGNGFDKMSSAPFSRRISCLACLSSGSREIPNCLSAARWSIHGDRSLRRSVHHQYLPSEKPRKAAHEVGSRSAEFPASGLRFVKYL
jgi:hypothetical protein